jgi:enamine deaminase RidA (YjgF/YER057c/UK114 family)
MSNNMNAFLPTDSRGTGAMPSCEAAMEWLPGPGGTHSASTAISRFQGSGGVTEFNVTVQLDGQATGDPVCALEDAWLAALASAGIPPESTVFRRVFCSDVVNQSPLLGGFRAAYPGAFSVVGQSPLPAAKLALWSQHWCDPAAPLETRQNQDSFACRRGKLTHHWFTGKTDAGPEESDVQTRKVLERHDRALAENSMTLAGNVVRTWWFVRNVDADYAGLVDARREFFATRGLDRQSHYIASTGIAGADANVNARLSFDSLAIAGLRPEQVSYLQAPSHLCPTHDYGVTFERATAIDYADRRQILISGTASIDATGQVVHPGDVLRQLDRTVENITALLAAAGANPGDLAVALVYLRDPADAEVIASALHDRFGAVPTVLLYAPVCRPGWLIEIEGVATVPAIRPDLPGF